MNVLLNLAPQNDNGGFTIDSERLIAYQIITNGNRVKPMESEDLIMAKERYLQSEYNE